MNTVIKRNGIGRKAMYNRSVSEGCAYNSQGDPLNETLPPPPCSGQSSTSFFNTEGNCSDTFENLKKSIMKEIRLEMRNVISPLIDEVKQLVLAIQTLTSSSKIEPLNTRVRAECSANDIAYSTSEPQELLKQTAESEDIYQDASRMASLAVRPGIDNELYGCVQERINVPFNDHDSDKEEKQVCQSQCRNKSNTNTKPKEIRSNSLQTRVKSVAVATVRPRSAIHINKVFDERECLAKALQFHIQELVDGVIFNDSELPDSLLANDCLTDDECSTLRKIKDRKDQIRMLLTLVKGRDLRVLKAFLRHVESQNQDVAQKIKDKFEKNKSDGVNGKLCARCKLENQFNVKNAADGLWSIEAIDDELYSRIISSDSPVGAQSTLWEKVIQSLNMLGTQKAEEAQIKLMFDLSNKNLFVHLADGVRDMLIKNHGKLTCSCEPKLVLHKRNSSFGATTSAESNLPDSLSESNSNDSSSHDGTESVDVQSNVCVSTDGMSAITEVNESLHSPSNEVHSLTYTHPPEADTLSLTALNNNSSSSVQKPTSMEKLQSTQFNSPTIVKKPVPPVKPPITLRKPDIKPEHISHSKQSDINESLKSDTLNIRVADNGLTGGTEDSIPPLPKKTNQTRKTLL